MVIWRGCRHRGAVPGGTLPGWPGTFTHYGRVSGHCRHIAGRLLYGAHCGYNSDMMMTERVNFLMRSNPEE